VAGASQTGVYSYFALGGDCEVTLAYELLNVEAPRKGYGSGVGLAFDAGDDVGRGAIQRVHKPAEGAGYVLERTLAGSAAKSDDDYRFVPAKAKRGRMGLRRLGKELIFLTSDTPGGPLEEVGRLPFTDRTIRVVRVFADAGGSPTVVDVRLREFAARADEITGGISEREQHATVWRWLWRAIPATGVALLIWFWRARRGSAADVPATTVRRGRWQKT
jgi:hypothetical protein